jgi:hypothetical protein
MRKAPTTPSTRAVIVRTGHHFVRRGFDEVADGILAKQKG